MPRNGESANHTLFDSDYSTYDAMTIAVCYGRDIENFSTRHNFPDHMERQSVKIERQRLFKAVMGIAKEYLTNKQLSVLRLFLDGLTQEKITEKLGVNQTTIHKTLFGNLVYNGPYEGRRHGGIVAKLRKLCLRDPNICCLLKRIESIRCADPNALPKQKYVASWEFKYKYPIRGEYLELSSGRLVFVGIANKRERKAYVYKNKFYDDKATLLSNDGYDVIELHYNGKIVEHRRTTC